MHMYFSTDLRLTMLEPKLLGPLVFVVPGNQKEATSILGFPFLGVFFLGASPLVVSKLETTRKTEDILGGPPNKDRLGLEGLVVYNAAISACEKLSQWQSALSLFRAIPLPDAAGLRARDGDDGWRGVSFSHWTLVTSVETHVGGKQQVWGLVLANLLRK